MIIFSEIFKELIITVVVASLLGFLRYIYYLFLKNKFDYLVGNWHSYYLMKNDTLLMEQKIIVKAKTFRTLKIRIEENSVPNYIYKGMLKVIEDSVFGELTGKYHPAKSFLVLKLPFNRRNKVPSMNGIFLGITQNKKPAAVAVHWSRQDKIKIEVKKELGKKKKLIIVNSIGAENIMRTIINEKKHIE